MNIAYLINQYPQASQSFIRREIAALQQQGITIHRFTVRRWDQPLVDAADRAEQSKTRAVLEGAKLTQMLRLLGATLAACFCTPLRFFGAIRLSLRCGRRAGGKRLLHLIYLAEACVLLRWMRGAGAEHIHAHFGTNSTTVAMLIHALGGPAYSFTVHGPEEFDKPQALSLGEKIARCAFVVAISSFGRSQLYRWVDPEHWPKVHVIRCGVDSLFLQHPPAPIDSREPRNPLPAGESDLVGAAPRTIPPAMQGAVRSADPAPLVPAHLVCIGRLVEQKGQLVLLEAAHLLKGRGVAFHITLIGDGTLRRTIETRIAELDLAEQIRIAGWMSNDEIRSALVAARGMVLPSFAEGLPVVLMESLALGRPVVTTNVAGIPELVTDGLCGFLVPPGDPAALADAMERLLALDGPALASMGTAGRTRVASRHDATAEAKKLAALYAAAIRHL